MSLQERSNLILDFAKVLFANGQATDQTIDATERLGRAIGLRATIIPRWGELELQTEDADDKLSSQVVADPSGVDMDRVASSGHVILPDGTKIPYVELSAEAAKIPTGLVEDATCRGHVGVEGRVACVGVGLILTPGAGLYYATLRW